MALVASLAAVAAAPSGFRPEPVAVKRYGAGYRYPQAGWWVVHIEGEPYERGVQHGRLLASEIAAHIRCFAQMYSSESPADSWKLLRMLGDALFLSKFEREYLEEMRGIADGASAAGAKFDGRPLELSDIATLNLWPEIMTLPWATEAVPTGLEGMRFEEEDKKSEQGAKGAGTTAAPLPPKPGHCSAFAATGPATADGKIVFGHITMFSLYPSTFYNIWLDVHPVNGHRVAMQTFPGGIHSGMDYYMNSAGILCSETTIDQTRLNAAGSPLASRIRKALQYSDSIDQAVDFLKHANNGLYTNEWLLADTKTNEIAMFELGTNTSKLYRSSKGEWFGGTEGFYWGCNNTKDLQVRLETIAATNDRPANMVWHPSDRDEMWLRLYRKHKGRIGVDFAKEAFTTSPICASASVDAKFTTTELAKGMKSWVIFGPPRGETWLPEDDEKRDYPGIEPLVSEPWAILHGEKPAVQEGGPVAVDLKDDEDGEPRFAEGDEEDRRRRQDEALPAKLVWRGTILPKNDGDIWLAAAFADYHRIVAREKGMMAVADNGCLCDHDLSKLAISLYARRAQYLSAAAAAGDTPLVSLRSDDASREWYRIASGKGVLVLGELRRRLGDESFVAMMDDFGLAYAGRPASWNEFMIAAAKTTTDDLGGFFNYWLKGTGLPTFALSGVHAAPAGSGENERYHIEGVLAVSGGLLPANAEMTVETEKDEVTQIVAIEASSGAFSLETEEAPKRLVVDKYARVAKANGGRFDLASFMNDFEQTIIVYGTSDEENGNRDAAEVLQERLRMAHSNMALPIVSDAAVTDEQLKNHHVLLIGRPGANRITERFRKALPISFGEQSFEVDGDFYGHPKSAVIMAGTNPLNPRYSVVVIAGLRALSTYQAASKLGFEDFGAEVKVLPHGDRAKKLVMPAPELVHVFDAGERVSKAGTE
jgi:hypothetical protein